MSDELPVLTGRPLRDFTDAEISLASVIVTQSMLLDPGIARNVLKYHSRLLKELVAELLARDLTGDKVVNLILRRMGEALEEPL